MQALVIRWATQVVFALGFAAIAPGAWAQTPNELVTVQEAELKAEVSPVVVDGATLFYLRGVSSVPSEERAATTAERIVQVAADRRFDPTQLKLVEEGMFTAIDAGDLRLMIVADADGRHEGVERELLAKIYAKRISKAIEDFRTQRSRDYLLQSSLYVLLASAILLLLFFALRWLARRTKIFLEQVAKKRIEAFEAKTFKLVRAQQLWELLASVINLTYWLAILVVVDVYLSYALGLFPWTRSFATIMRDALVAPLKSMLDGISSALPGLLFIALLIVVLRYFLGLVKLFFAGLADSSIAWHGFEPEWALPTYRLVRVFIIAFGVVVAYPYIPGSESEAFKGMSILFGLIISLGSSSIIGNILAGYTLVYRRAFKMGDRIQVGEHVGDVTHMRTLETQLLTPKNEVVVVPNSQLLNSNIINYSAMKRQGGLILHTTVGIGYETPWRQVEAMLLTAADRTTGLLKQPPPFVLKKSLGDFCVVYEINAHTDTPEQMPRLYSRLHDNVLDLFNEYGVQIMTPAYEGDPSEPKVVPKASWYAAPAKAPSQGPVTDSSSPGPG